MEIEFVQISEQLPFPAEFMRYLSASRQQRIHRFRNDNDKKRGLLAELLIQKYASRLYNMGRNEYEIQTTEYGKPYIPELPEYHFSISHSGLYAAIGVSKAPIGIDVETISPIDLAVAKRFFAGEEYAYVMEPEAIPERWIRFYRIWTLKESYVKAMGWGMYRSFSSFAFHCGREIITCEDPEGEQDFRFGSELFAKTYLVSICHQEEAISRYVVKGEEEFYKNWMEDFGNCKVRTG